MFPVIRNAPGGKGGRCVRLTTYHHYSAVVTKTRSLNFPRPFRDFMDCWGRLYLLLPKKENWQRYETIVLSVCESVRVPWFKLFSPLTDFDETSNESHFIAGHFRSVRFTFLSNTRLQNSTLVGYKQEGNYCCRGKAVSISYFECFSAALFIRHAKRVHYIATCGLSGCTEFFPIISQTARLSGVTYRTQNVRFDFLNKFCLKYF